MDAATITQDALVFPSNDDHYENNDNNLTHTHSPPKADQHSNTSTNSHNTDDQDLDLDLDLDRLHEKAMADLFGSETDPAPPSQSKSPDHPPPAQASTYSLIDPELRPPVLSRQQSWQDSSETDFSSEPDVFHPTRRSSVDSGIASSGDDLGVGNLPFLEPQQQFTVEQGQGVPPPKPKKSHARKQPPGHIPRARNAFILFRKHITDSNLIPASVEIKHQNISVVAAKMWREAPPDVRAKFQELARIEKEEHQRKYPGYRYQPVFRRTDIIRRRVRKEAHEDDKVEAVAELLMKGKAGSALEKEIKEQLRDRTGEESDSGVESSGASTTSRRRRQDAGQLSKGALRAQKAQNRARALRQSAYDAEMINLQHMNPGYGAIGPNGLPYAPDEAYLLDYGGLPQRRGFHGEYGYDEGQAFTDSTALYPPVQVADGALDGYAQLQGRNWSGQHQPYYDNGFQDPTAAYQAQITDPAYFTQPDQYQPGPQYDAQPLAPTYPAGEYGSMPPSNNDPSHNGDHAAFGVGPRPSDLVADQYARGVDLHLADENDQGEDPRMRWSREQLPTPSNHVSFQDDLFAGEGGSLGLDRDLQDYVGAMEQAEQALPSGW